MFQTLVLNNAFFLLNFQGIIKIEATLDAVPAADSDWFKVSEFDTTSSEITENFSRNITGYFVWIRARVENFEAGTITKLTLSY